MNAAFVTTGEDKESLPREPSRRPSGRWLNTVSVTRSFSADQHHRSRKRTEAHKLIAADEVTHRQTHRDDEFTNTLMVSGAGHKQDWPLPPVQARVCEDLSNRNFMKGAAESHNSSVQVSPFPKKISDNRAERCYLPNSLVL